MADSGAPAATTAAAPGRSSAALDYGSIAICTLAWGTTWFAITLQLGVVDPVVSVVYRFGVAAVLLLVWCAVTRQPFLLTPRQHIAAVGVGFFTFTINYPMVYMAEERVTSAVVAVVFASLAFINLITFRLLFGQRAPILAWAGAALGICGVGLLSWGEIVGAHMSARALEGIGITLASVVAASAGNAAAHKAEETGAPLVASTGWAMAYGAGLLAIFAEVSGRTWRFEATSTYVFSLFYLAIIGSVIAFLVYYALARRRGYALASYISALAPLLAMTVSAVLEHKHWGAYAFAGAAVTLVGQMLMLRAKRA